MSISPATVAAGATGWAWNPDPPEDLPPARYALGARVTTRWGAGTIAGVENWALLTSGRCYNVHHDFSSAPPNFGHCFGEFDIEPLVTERAEMLEDDAPATNVPQLELFA